MAYKVRLVKDLNDWMRKLEEASSKGDKNHNLELKLLNKAITKLKENCKAGQILPRKSYPAAYKEYSRRYGGEVTIDKLWVLKVSPDWRVIYTVVSNEVDIISFILDTMNHKVYDRKFNFG